ncbi:MAG: hypothetical protein ACR2IK_25180 [Chloroflexota bacterium]
MHAPTPTRAGPGGDQPPESGRPPYVVAALIVAVGLVIFLGATRWFLAQPAPTPANVPTLAPRPAPTSGLAAAPVPTAVVRPVETVPLRPVATVPLRPVATPTQRTVVTAAPAATPAPTPVPTLTEEWWTRSSSQVDPEQAQLVLAALDRYWAVLNSAWKDLDTSHLAEALVEPDLSQQRTIFGEWRARGKGIQVAVDHADRQVRDIRLDEAVVYEEYLNHSAELDLKTGALSADVTPKQAAAAYLFRKSASGQWKVAEVATK